MVVCYFYFFMLLVVVDGGVIGITDCGQSSCGVGGPPIRFPFRIKDRQPDYCGYPGFDLSCTEQNDTVIELPTSAKLFVTSINYTLQTVETKDPTGCLLRQRLNLKASASPFQSAATYSYNFTLFNCSRAKREESFYYNEAPCLSALNYAVFLVDSTISIGTSSLVSCTKMHDIVAVPWEIFNMNVLVLSWSDPACKSCEKKGNRCRLKNSSKIETECYRESLLKPTRGTKVKVLTAGSTTGLCLLFVVGVILYRNHKVDKAERVYQLKVEKFLDDYKALKPTRYSYADIKRITNEFKGVLGQGAYGTVYKGKLSDDVPVAVKVLNSSKGNGEEFVIEVGTMGRIHHVNVVRLVGYCADGFRRALVYEYLPKGSLQKFISSADIKNHFLVWKRLLDIAIGIARGIEYLHQGCDLRILHFDIKPHNVLLDNDFTPKISDFGMAKLCSKDQSAVSMTTARGTVGYIAPEVFSRNFGNVSYKSDVYSFGMLILEMVGGRKNIDDKSGSGDLVYFPQWIYNLLEHGEDLRVDIEEERDADIAKKLAVVGLWCIQWNPADRPSMKFVVQMLEGESISLRAPPNPFSSTNPMGTNASKQRRHLRQELGAISEAE